MKTLRNKNEKGFTLIELLVVIAIIGLLASVVLLALNSARAKSRDAKRLADVRQIASALELYFNDVSSYPTSNGAVVSQVTGEPRLTPTYLGIFPASPNPADGTCDSTTNAYRYISGVAGQTLTGTYSLGFCLGAATGGYSAGLHTLTPAGIQ